MLRDASPPFPLTANAYRGFTLLELLSVVAIGPTKVTEVHRNKTQN